MQFPKTTNSPANMAAMDYDYAFWVLILFMWFADGLNHHLFRIISICSAAQQCQDVSC